MATSLATFFGLRAPSATQPAPYYSAYYLSFSCLLAYGIITSRLAKRYYGLDHQASPREDLTKYGPAAVAKGKLTQRQLDQLRRIESAQANSVEHFPIFATAIVFAHVAGLQPEVINATGLYYAVARVIYALSYVFIEGEKTSGWRALFWWASNVICIRSFLLSGQAINGKLP